VSACESMTIVSVRSCPDKRMSSLPSHQLIKYLTNHLIKRLQLSTAPNPDRGEGIDSTPVRMERSVEVDEYWNGRSCFAAILRIGCYISINEFNSKTVTWNIRHVETDNI
jgi:hypothetical protein